ncbi:CAP Gly-rich domain-containing protein, partial [Ochromonadaceae sp. CCMP2298]
MASTLKVTTVSDIVLGAKVLTGAGYTKKGEVKFIGPTQFAAGEWVGIQLDLPEGKNDGSVAGEFYFDAPPLHGLFVKRTLVKI